MAARRNEGDAPISAVVIRPDGKSRIVDFAKLADADLIANALIILPKQVGGLSDGLLDSESDNATDVSDLVPDKTGSAKRVRLCIHALR